MTDTHCRFCAQPLTLELCDLGLSPRAHALLDEAQLDQPERFFPLRAFVCEGCWLVQLANPPLHDGLFDTAPSGLGHALTSTDAMRSDAQASIARLALDRASRVIEVGSGGGARLRPYADRGIQVLGVEANAGDAHSAIFAGVTTRVRAFSSGLADELVAEGLQADLLVSNDQLSRASDLNDTVAGLKRLLKPEGVLTLELPYVLRMLWGNQFDLLSLERPTYFSLLSAEQVLKTHGLAIFDVEELPQRGDMLRIFACHETATTRPRRPSVDPLRQVELDAGLATSAPYASFHPQVVEARMQLLESLFQARRAGQRVWGYGVPARAVTLLNYCGVRSDLLERCVDPDARRANRFVPGVRVPVRAVGELASGRPEIVLVLARHHLEDIQAALGGVLRSWGGRLAVAVPEFRLLG